MIKFKSIKDFASLRENCLFCHSKLDFVFTTWFRINKPGLPLINSFIKDDHFIFKFKHNSPSSSINTKVDIDITTNTLTYYPINDTIDTLISVLEGLRPHVELQCNNKKCKMNYYICSETFSFKQGSNKILIKTFSPFMECFSCDNLWIQNYYRDDTTTITKITGSIQTDKSITVPKLKLNNLNKDKIINKIKTMVIFS